MHVKAGDKVIYGGGNQNGDKPPIHGQIAEVIKVGSKTVSGNYVKLVFEDGQTTHTYSNRCRPLLPEPAKTIAPLPYDSAERKTYPLMSGLFDYFESALCAVAHHSHVGNEKHNPGEPIHWARGKSDDHLDAAMRHLVERDLTGAAWRVLAALQLELESKGRAVAPGARVNGTK